MSTSIAAPSSQSATRGPTAGQRIYSIPHIRRQIIRNLSRSSQANLLRTEKACFEEVVKELYYAVSVKVVEEYMGNDPIRRPIYTNAVVEVDAQGMHFSAAMRRIPGWERFKRDSVIDDYDPTTFNFVVPHLRFKLPSLRKIRFEVDGGYAEAPGVRRWLVNCHRAPGDDLSTKAAPEYDGGGYVGELSGSIDFLENRFTGVWRSVTSTAGIEGPKPPKGSYTIRYRFNLRLYHAPGAPVDPNVVRYWSRAFRELPGFDNLHTSLNINEIPLSMDDVIALYQRQVSAGHAARLQVIKANMLVPWQLSTFALLASVSSATLTSLEVLGGAGSPRPHITLSDIPALITTIRANLPHLTTLALGIDEVVGPEAVCGQLLTQQSLDDGGTLTSLTIGVWRAEDTGAEGEDEEEADTVPPCFNFIRLMSALCVPEASIRICGGDKTAQSDYLRYLRRQPQHCRVHLATVDFPSLGLTSLSHVFGLNYNRDGRPVMGPPRLRNSREKTKTAQWASAFTPYQNAFKSDELKERFVITTGMDSCTRISAHLDEISPTGAVWEREAAAKQLLESMLVVEAEADRAKASLDVEGVRAYLKSLESETQAGEGTSGV